MIQLGGKKLQLRSLSMENHSERKEFMDKIFGIEYSTQFNLLIPQPFTIPKPHKNQSSTIK